MNEFIIWLTTAMRQRWTGEVVLYDEAGKPTNTRFYRPGLERPQTIMHRGSAYGDTGRNDYHGFRIYRQNWRVHHYIPGTE